MLDFILFGFFDSAAKLPNFWPQKNPDQVRVSSCLGKLVLLFGRSVRCSWCGSRWVGRVFLIQAIYY